jgi:hypothetical protein
MVIVPRSKMIDVQDQLQHSIGFGYNSFVTDHGKCDERWRARILGGNGCIDRLRFVWGRDDGFSVLMGGMRRLVRGFVVWREQPP